MQPFRLLHCLFRDFNCVWFLGHAARCLCRGQLKKEQNGASKYGASTNEGAATSNKGITTTRNLTRSKKLLVAPIKAD